MSPVLAEAPTHSHMSWLPVIAAVLITLLATGVFLAGRRLGWNPTPGPLRGLPPDQRRQVAVAVQQGRAVDDPALAPIAVELAELQAARLAFTAGRGWRLFSWSLSGLFAALAVAAVVQGDLAGATLQVLIVALCLANPYLHRWLYSRAVQSADANARLLSGPSGPPPIEINGTTA